MSKHAATLALGRRLSALGPRYRSLSADLSALGGDLVTEAPALSVLDRMVTRLEELEGSEARTRHDLDRLGVAVRKALEDSTG